MSKRYHCDFTVCDECGLPFERGEKVVMKRQHLVYHFVFLHEKCYRDAYGDYETLTLKTRSEWLKEWRKLNPRSLSHLRK